MHSSYRRTNAILPGNSHVVMTGHSMAHGAIVVPKGLEALHLIYHEDHEITSTLTSKRTSHSVQAALYTSFCVSFYFWVTARSTPIPTCMLQLHSTVGLKLGQKQKNRVTRRTEYYGSLQAIRSALRNTRTRMVGHHHGQQMPE